MSSKENLRKLSKVKEKESDLDEVKVKSLCLTKHHAMKTY